MRACTTTATRSISTTVALALLLLWPYVEVCFGALLYSTSEYSVRKGVSSSVPIFRPRALRLASFPSAGDLASGSGVGFLRSPNRGAREKRRTTQEGDPPV